jgi:hypothetical protein
LFFIFGVMDRGWVTRALAGLVANLEKDLASCDAGDPCKFKLTLLMSFAKRGEDDVDDVAAGFGVFTYMAFLNIIFCFVVESLG